MAPPDLPALAEAVAAWADAHPHVWRVYVFGSRVRGDHRPDSDLDVVVQPPPGGIADECLAWWQEARKLEEKAFPSLRAAIHPIELHLAQLAGDRPHEWIARPAWDPDDVVLRIGKVTCLWTPSRGNVVA